MYIWTIMVMQDRLPIGMNIAAATSCHDANRIQRSHCATMHHPWHRPAPRRPEPSLLRSVGSSGEGRTRPPRPSHARVPPHDGDHEIDAVRRSRRPEHPAGPTVPRAQYGQISAPRAPGGSNRTARPRHARGEPRSSRARPEIVPSSSLRLAGSRAACPAPRAGSRRRHRRSHDSRRSRRQAARRSPSAAWPWAGGARRRASRQTASPPPWSHMACAWASPRSHMASRRAARRTRA